MRIDHLRTKIETFQRKPVIIRQEELVSISYCETKRVVIIFVISGTDEAGTDLTTLINLRKSALIRKLCTAAEP